MNKENVNYMGSIIIDKQLIEKAGLEPGEKVAVCNIICEIFMKENSIKFKNLINVIRGDKMSSDYKDFFEVEQIDSDYTDTD